MTSASTSFTLSDNIKQDHEAIAPLSQPGRAFVQTFAIAAVGRVNLEGPAFAGLLIPPEDGLKGVVAIGAGASSDGVIEGNPCASNQHE